jgi:hypothetical protein
VVFKTSLHIQVTTGDGSGLIAWLHRQGSNR